MSNFRKGGEAAKESAERSGGAFNRINYFGMKDGESQAARFITEEDDWITVAMHNGVPTRPAPAGFKGAWPTVMSAVCRKDKAFEGQHSDCFICQFLKDTRDPTKPFKRADRTWGLLIMREEQIVDGKLAGIVDTLKEVSMPGENGGEAKTVHVPDVRVATMAYKNFWGGLQGMAQMNGTVRDRDYKIKRIGASTETIYQMAPYPQIQVPVNGVATIYDLRDDQFISLYDIPDLGDMVTEKASDEHYALFFDTRVAQPVRGDATTGTNNGGPASPVPPNSNDLSPEALAAMANRVSSFGGQAPQPQPVSQPMQQPAPAATSGFLQG